MAKNAFCALVVDDNKRHRQMIGSILGSLGARVELAGDGLAATRLIREHEAAEGRARANIIMVTSHDEAEDVARSREAGADHHMPKPINPADLVCALEGCFWL